VCVRLNVYGPKEPHGSRLACMYLSQKQPRIPSKEPYIPAKEPHISPTEPYLCAKEPHISTIEP